MSLLATLRWCGTSRQRLWLRGLLVAVALYLALRVGTLLVLDVYAHADPDHPTLRTLLTNWDAVWYGGIAEHGYDEAIPLDSDGDPELTNLAFFPLYPALVAAAKFLLPIHITTALLLVAWACGLTAAAALYGIGAHLRDPRTGVLLAALWAVLPHGVVESMGYSEPLFTTLAAGALLAVLRRNWLTAGVLCVLAGLTRPTAAALVLAVGLAALVQVCREPARWRAWCAMLLAPVGLLGYLAWVGVRLGRADGYFYVQNVAWNMKFDGGGYTRQSVTNTLLGKESVEFAEVTVVLLVATLLFIVAVGERLPWPLLVYAGACLAIVLTGDGFYWAKARHLMPAFPLLLPVAYAMVRSRNRTIPYVVIGGMAVFCAFWSVYLNLTWTHSF
ncbi:glycosyltransferase family 39 protein [Krasilnikovia sp. M28-CT-15]